MEEKLFGPYTRKDNGIGQKETLQKVNNLTRLWSSPVSPPKYMKINNFKRKYENLNPKFGYIARSLWNPSLAFFHHDIYTFYPITSRTLEFQIQYDFIKFGDREKFKQKGA